MKHFSNRITALLLGLAWLCGSNATAQSTRKPTAATQRSARPDPCTLVTQAEAEAIMGEKLGPPQKRAGGGCWFGESLAFSFLPVSPASSAEFEAFIKKEVDKLNAKMREIGAKESTIDRVADLEATAFYVDPTLLVYRNKQVLSVFADRPKAVAAAKKAMERWK